MNQQWHVLVGALAAIVLPAQGLQFTNAGSAGALSFTAVAYDGRGNFVAVADNGWGLACPFTNNNQWEPAKESHRSIAPGTALNTVAFGSNVFLAGGVNARICASSDGGVDWGSPTLTNEVFGGNTYTVEGLAFNPMITGGGRFVAVALAISASYSHYNETNHKLEWQRGSIEDPIIFEGYRDVTAMGADQFALCGNLGTIRISRDGGTNWIESEPLGVSKPNLFGIAWDESQTLVCVGGGGAIRCNSSNGSNTWVDATSTTAADLNDVAFTGSEFIAVGNGGVILSSPDGSNWTRLAAPAESNPNLRAIACGRTGQMIGVTFIAGDNGTILLGGTPPPAPGNPTNNANCASIKGADNGQISVDVNDDTNHPSGTFTVDWYDAGFAKVVDGTNGYVSFSNGTFYLRPTNSLPAGAESPSTNIYYAQSRDLRTGLTNSTLQAVRFVVNPRPSSTLVSVNRTTCNDGSAYVIEAALTGQGPWEVTWWDGAVSNVVASPALRTVYPTSVLADAATNFEYWVAALSDAHCTATEPGDLRGTNIVRVNPRPSSTLVSADRTTCNDGSAYVIEAALTGQGPWEVTWWDGAVSNVAARPALRTVYPTNVLADAATNFAYWVAALSDAHCTATEPGDLRGTNVVTVHPNLVVTGPPVSTTQCPNDTVSFSVIASGTGLAYQWKTNDVALTNSSKYSGVTNATLYITNVTADDALIYQVVLTGTCGSVTNEAALTVAPATTAVGPAAQTNCPGTTAHFAVLASGAALTYQWKTNGTALSDSSKYGGVTTAMLSITNVTAADELDYTVEIIGTCGNATNTATLTLASPVAATALTNATCCPGDAVVFSTTASGTGPITYEWLKDGTLITGQTTWWLAFTNVAAGDAARYTVIVSGACGQVTNHAILTVNTNVEATPLISQTKCPGDTVVFSTTASGTGPYAYGWLKNGVVLSGQTTDTLTLPNVTASDAASYSVIVSGACGQVTHQATLTVVALSGPVSQTADPGGTARFDVTASGGDFTYQWQTNGVALVNSAKYAGVTEATLFIINVTAYDALAYAVDITGPCGRVTNHATLTVTTLTISLDPSGTNAVLQWEGDLLLESATSLTNPVTWTLLTNGAAGGPNYYHRTNIWFDSQRYFRARPGP